MVIVLWEYVVGSSTSTFGNIGIVGGAWNTNFQKINTKEIHVRKIFFFSLSPYITLSLMTMKESDTDTSTLSTLYSSNSLSALVVVLYYCSSLVLVVVVPFSQCSFHETYQADFALDVLLLLSLLYL